MLTGHQQDHLKALGLSDQEIARLQASGFNWQQILAIIQAVISALANLTPPRPTPPAGG